MTSPSAAPGDPIIHPAHGLGEVVSVKERELLGEERTYLTLDMENMRVLVPADEADEIGLREPVAADEVPELMELLGEAPVKDPGHRGRRRRNDKRIRSGEADELAKVIRSLKKLQADSENGLKHADRTHLREAMERLTAELAVVLDCDVEEAEQAVLEAVEEAASDAPVEDSETAA